MERFVTQRLLEWQQKKGRKPLVLSGVRQVGKTTVLRSFASQHFANYYYINFEKQPEMHAVFSGDLSPKILLQQLEIKFKKTIDKKNDCLILDEVQACPRALTSLKYFCEECREFAVCSAGSLLGVHLNDVSYPVGKVDMLTLHPMTFREFLLSAGEQRSLETMDEIIAGEKTSSFVHSHLWEQLKQYFIVGGLPEVVATYHQYDSPLSRMQAVREKQNNLITAYYADIAKHSGKINAMHIDRVWRAVPEQLAKSRNDQANKFKFKDVLPNQSRYHQLTGPIDWLKAAGLIFKVPICHHAELPLSAYTKANSFKLYCFDIGILGAMSGLPPETILDYEYGTYKGYFAENFVLQSLLYLKDSIYSWEEGRAEVEFLDVVSGKVIPIEVKSGWVTRSQSIYKFQQKYASPYRVVMSAQPMRISLEDALYQIPLYLAEDLNQIINFNTSSENS